MVSLIPIPGDFVQLEIDTTAGLLGTEGAQGDVRELGILDFTVVIAVCIADREDLDGLFLGDNVNTGQGVGVVADDFSHADSIIDVLDGAFSSCRNVRLYREYLEGVHGRLLDGQRLGTDMGQLTGQEYARCFVHSSHVLQISCFSFVIMGHGHVVHTSCL